MSASSLRLKPISLAIEEVVLLKKILAHILSTMTPILGKLNEETIVPSIIPKSFASTDCRVSEIEKTTHVIIFFSSAFRR